MKSEISMLSEIVERALEEELPCEGDWCAHDDSRGITCLNHRRRPYARAACLAVAKAVVEECRSIAMSKSKGFVALSIASAIGTLSAPRPEGSET